MDNKMISTLKQARMRAKISQEELAHRANVSRETIRNIEDGTSIPNVLLALKISRLVGIEVYELFKPLK